MRPALTYVYCIVQRATAPGLRGTPGGVPGAGPVRALDAGDGLWLIAADVPEREYGEAAIAAGLQRIEWVSQRALGHEAMVEHFLRARALLPMQLFTLFTSDDRALDHVVRDRRRIDSVVERLSGQVEWGLRVAWDEHAARQAVEKAHQVQAKERGPSGAAYLARKRDLLALDRVNLARARDEAARLFEQMSDEATDAMRRTSTEQAVPGSRLVLDAAFLVPAGRGSAFRKALRRQMNTALAAGLTVSLTGPWPPYNFIAAPTAGKARLRRKAAARATRRPARRGAASKVRRTARRGGDKGR